MQGSSCEYAGQHIRILRSLTSGVILPCVQGLVKVLRTSPLRTNTDQQNPIMASTDGRHGECESSDGFTICSTLKTYSRNLDPNSIGLFSQQCQVSSWLQRRSAPDISGILPRVTTLEERRPRADTHGHVYQTIAWIESPHSDSGRGAGRGGRLVVKINRQGPHRLRCGECAGDSVALRTSHERAPTKGTPTHPYAGWRPSKLSR